MRLLIVSHPCVNPLNQQFFAEVERQTGWDMTIVAPSNWRDEYGAQPGLERWSGYHGRLVGIPVWRPGNIPLHVYHANFSRLLRTSRPNVIYVHHEPYAAATIQVALANRLAGRRPLGFYAAQNILKRYPWPFCQGERLVLREGAFALPVSETAAQVLRQKGYAGPLEVLPLAVDSELFLPRLDIEELRHAWGATEGTAVIGYLGRLAEEKGLQTLLQALERIRSLPWRLVVAGEGPHRQTLTDLARQPQLTGRVTFTGFAPREEAPRYLSAFDLLVLPSESRPGWREQFGRVVTEALACGTPVLGSDSGEIPHLLRATGGGLVFPEGRADELADRLRELIRDAALRERLATAGRAAVLRDYAASALAQRFVRVVGAAAATQE